MRPLTFLLRRPHSATRLSVVGLVLLVLGSSARSAAADPLTGVETLARAYGEVLDGRFAEAARELAACSGAPAVACVVLDATRAWWQVQMDPFDRSRDAELSKKMDGAIAAAEGWVKREPNRAEAWFYLGGAYGVRVQWRVLRGEHLAAARDGKRIKDALERSLQLDPTLEDANFGIGLYQYYADIAPAFAKFLRWLLLLPEGDKVGGLARMLRASSRGALVRGEAEYQLHIIYLWYERDFEKALGLVQDLSARYPGNPLFLQIAAEIHNVYFHDPTSSEKTYERLLSLALDRKINQAGLAEQQARLGLAEQLETLFESDRALEQARAVIASRPAAPLSAMARAWLYAGQALLHLGQSDEARAAFAQALAVVPGDDPFHIRDQVVIARRRTVDAKAAEAYRLMLMGWRAYERRSYREAEAALARAVALRPSDMVSRYRYGRVLEALGATGDARAQWQLVTSAGDTTPPAVFADACVALATLVAEGDAPRARDLYLRAAHTFGAARDTRAAAARNASQIP